MSFKPTFAQVQEVVADESGIGWCRRCGGERSCCEPDARMYPCPECGANEVYGAEEYLLRGWLIEEE